MERENMQLVYFPFFYSLLHKCAYLAYEKSSLLRHANFIKKTIGNHAYYVN